MSEENRNQFWWELLISLEEKRQEIESRLADTTDSEFEEYCLIWEVLGVIYEKVSSL